VGPSGRVIAFEPDPANYEYLLRNIKRHGLSNVVAVRAALSDGNGEAEFHAEATLGSGLSEFATRPSLSGVQTVETMTLERACERYGSPAFVKMDIEGAEIAVLADTEYLRRFNASFVLDTNHIVNGKRTDAAVELAFQAAGYKVETLDEDGLVTTWAWR
jgi:FkbM family methyltransferase